MWRSAVERSRVARLATITSDGRPHLVPFCFALAADVIYSAVDSKRKRSPELQRLRNLERDPRVTVLVDHYEEDWQRLWWVRLDGRASLVSSAEEAAQALSLLQAKYEQYVSEPPAGPFLRIEVERTRGWRAA